MARYKIKAIDLAKEIKISANAVSNLRKSDTMPRLDGDSLNNLCNALNKLALGLDEQITPVTLIEYTRDDQPGNEPKSSSSAVPSKTKRESKAVSSKAVNYPRSVLIVIPNSKSA